MKRYIKNNYLLNHSISVHLFETDTKFGVEVILDGVKTVKQFSKEHQDSSHKSNMYFQEKLNHFNKVITLVHFNSK